MTNIVFLKQEAGRKRLAKLLGIAPFRVDMTLDDGGVVIEIDGRPATSEQMQTFWNDVASLVTKAKGPPN